jgi:hypothetical protein
LFHILKHGKPMKFKYEAHKELFDFLNLEENSNMHWTNLIPWGMVQHMQNMVLDGTIFIITTT